MVTDRKQWWRMGGQGVSIWAWRVGGQDVVTDMGGQDVCSDMRGQDADMGGNDMT